MSEAPARLLFFVDSADRQDWERVARTGWLAGATTNPTLLERAGLDCSVATALDLVRSAEDLGFRELHIQSWGENAAILSDHGRALASISPIVTVKMPATDQGVDAARRMKAEGYRVTLTACYTVRQCAVARGLELDYVAPYYGRMIEAGIDADRRLDGMRTVAQGSGLRILIASLRTGDQLDGLLSRGFDTFTLSPALAQDMLADPHSAAAVAAFEKATARPAGADGAADRPGA